MCVKTSSINLFPSYWLYLQLSIDGTEEHLIHSKHKHKSHSRDDDCSGSRKREHENQENNGSGIDERNKSSSKHSKSERHHHRSSRYTSLIACSTQSFRFFNTFVFYERVLLFFPFLICNCIVPIGTTIN